MGCYCSTGHRFCIRNANGKCGMRHPSSDLSKDDLSRLTGASTTASTPSHDSSNNSFTILPIISDDYENINHFKSTYLPQIIDPLEWQKSRKRKDRHDSTSSITQDRKLVRSNSEEFIPNSDCEVIRRVASHEDFKKPLNDYSSQNILKTITENELNQQSSEGGIKDMARSRIETSPARSHHMSPNRDYHSGRYKENDDSDWEHERRRSSERFSKLRATPGRKVGNIKKSNKHFSRLRERDENVYKNDINVLKYECRGFASKFKLDERSRKEEAADGEKLPINDYNDNNLIDFHTKKNYLEKSGKHHESIAKTTAPKSPSIPKNHETIAESLTLPWERPVQEDQAPVLCPRFEEYGKVSNVTQMETPINENNSVNMCINNDKMEYLKTHDTIQSIPPVGLFLSPDERLKQINKRLAVLKKRICLLEENYERNYGYRPSQAEKFGDRQIKNVFAEISKLRKEKRELKTDPMSALGLKVFGGISTEKKLCNMKASVEEIEKQLTDERKQTNRSENLEDITPDQLVQEKASIQSSLLYLESLYGRPISKEEREIARPLYERYRTVKRLLTRSVSISANGIGVSELPTILEHEAMVFTNDSFQMQSSDSNELIVSPAASDPSQTLSSTSDSQNDNNISIYSLDTSNDTSDLSENIHTLSIDELWENLEKMREEKKQLKHTIQEFEEIFEIQNGRKMLKTDRKTIEDTYLQYKQKKAKVRLIQALIRKHISN